MKRSLVLYSLGFLASCLALVQSAQAGSFTISNASTAAQTLGTGSGQTGTITSTGSLTVSGGTVAVTISGNNATLSNDGTIRQTGTGRVIRDNTGVTGLIINNGSATNAAALMQAADADVIQMNVPAASVTLNNYGTMTSLNASKGGAQAVDFSAITSGANTINNFSTGIMQAKDADAVRPGVNGVVYNAGTMKSTVTTDTGSDGIDAQNNSGIQITNDINALVEGARHGITGGASSSSVNFTMSITNNAGARVLGDNGSGINIDGFNNKEVVTIMNHGTITGNGVTGDGDGVDVDGLVNLTNTGTIKSLNSFSSTTPGQSEGVTVGGGAIINSGTIEGDVAAGNSNAVGRGITLAGVDTSGTPEPIYANSTITNQAGGLIKGQTDSAIAVDGAASGFTVTINNNAGATIEGGGAMAAAIRTGADNDTLNNAGIIIADSSGKAVDLGAGNNTLNITGGSASITGNVSGGVGGTNTLTIDPGSGNKFSYSGQFSNFASAEIKSGTVVLSGASTYTGNTLVSGGTLVANNSTGSATGTGNLTVNQGATLAGTGIVAPASGKSVILNGLLQLGDPTLAALLAGELTLKTSGAGAAILGATSQMHVDLLSGAGLGNNTGNSSAADRFAIWGNLTIASGASLYFDNPNNMTGWAVGDTWHIFDLANLGALSGSYADANISLPTLGTGMKWDTTALFTTGNLAITTPESGPGLLTLALCGAVGITVARRKGAGK